MDTGIESKPKSRIPTFVYLTFLGIWGIAAFFLPQALVFQAIILATVIFALAGFIKPQFWNALIVSWGMIAIIVLIIEGAHYFTAEYRYDLPIKNVSVIMLAWSSSETGTVGTGVIQIDIPENEVNADPELQNQISWIAVAGSIGVLIFTVAYFLIPTTSNVPALFGAVAFIWHQAPFLTNDQSICISKGWMSSEFAYVWFFIGLLAIVISAVYARHRGEGMISPRVVRT